MQWTRAAAPTQVTDPLTFRQLKVRKSWDAVQRQVARADLAAAAATNPSLPVAQ